MLTKNEFVEYVLGLRSVSAGTVEIASALPGDFDDFDEPGPSAAVAPDPTDFARGLLERCFGDAPEMPVGDILVPRDDADQRRLDAEYAPGAHYWRKTAERPFHVVLVRLKRTGSAVLSGAARRTVRELQLLEDELHRRLQDGLVWFERGGPRRTTEMPQGAQTETLYVVAITDDRPDGDPRQLVCFGTRATATGALEAFVLREEVLDWDAALAREHLDAFFARHLDPLGKGPKWQDAFVTGEERKKARKLMDECSKLLPDQKRLQSTIRDLLDEIAGSFGLRRKGGKHGHRLVLHALPENHSIAVDPPDARKKGFQNPFQGIRVFDASERLLGYIVYVVNGKGSAAKLARHLKDHNHFHNVLVVYPDQQDTKVELWQGGQPLTGSLRGDKKASQFNGEGGVVQLLSRFFIVSRTEIHDSKKLAFELAWRAQHLRALALDELKKEEGKPAGKRPLRDLLDIFNQALATLDEEQFADAYAQTITYGLLAARWLSAEREDLPFARKNVEELLPSTSPFLHDLFAKLINSNFDVNLQWLLDDVTSLLGRTTVSRIRFGSNDPSIHFYEDFLDEYDKRIRAERGVYYTPDEVVSYIVRTAHAALQERFGLPLGLADTTTWRDFAKARGIAVPEGVDPTEPFVQILDPACGTGTFPLRVIEVVHETMVAEYARRGLDAEAARKEWVAYVRKHLLPRLNGFELMMAPYIVTHLRLGLALQQTGFSFGKQDRLRVFLTNTLEMHTAPQLALIGEHVAEEAREAERVKKDAAISVIVGNPPYERESAESDGGHKAGWIRDGWDGWNDGRAPIEDYAEPTRNAGAGGHLKNIYNLYVYFWRWAGWRVFDRHRAPGIVSFITASSYLRGPGFVGMREEFRRSGNRVAVLDLEGDQRGTRVTDNVFCITIPVCVGTVLADRPDRGSPAASTYFRVTGTREEKLAGCAAWAAGQAVPWLDAPEGWQEPLMAGGSVDYDGWPGVTDLFPWQHSGAQYKRKWPIGETKEVLVARWETLVSSSRSTRATLFKESRDRVISRSYSDILSDVPLPAIASLTENSKCIAPVRYDYRSFNRMWCLPDNRSGDYLRGPLWATASVKQVFLSSFLTNPLGQGPGATACAFPPDLDHFRGSFGAKNLLPLWRDPEATQPNLAAGFLAALTAAHGRRPRPEDVFAYAYAVLANPSYVARFEEELQVPGPRLPVTKDRALFDRGAALGRALLRWHTYGERFREPGDGFVLTGAAREVVPIPRDPAGYPEKHRYDEATRTLHVGKGQVAPVPPEVMGFSVSGLQVVKSWLDYRMKKGAGKKSSPLDDIRPERWTDELSRELLELLWVLEWTLGEYPTLDAWLDEVLDSELFTADEIPPPTDAERKAPKVERKRQTRFA